MEAQQDPAADPYKIGGFGQPRINIHALIGLLNSRENGDENRARRLGM